MRAIYILSILLIITLNGCTTVEIAKEVTKAGNSIKTTIQKATKNQNDLEKPEDVIKEKEKIIIAKKKEKAVIKKQKENAIIKIQIGHALANLHHTTHSTFGFDFDNTIGEMPQFNAINTDIISWKEFYWQYRLKYQIEYAYNSNLLDYDLYERLLSIEPKLSKYIDNTIKPSLLHGDLWSGNIINGKDNPYFIDSACYFGHREIDFALIHMFGGFSDDFIKAYNEKYKLDEGFEQRKPIYMLYHYLKIGRAHV